MGRGDGRQDRWEEESSPGLFSLERLTWLWAIIDRGRTGLPVCGHPVVIRERLQMVPAEERLPQAEETLVAPTHSFSKDICLLTQRHQQPVWNASEPSPQPLRRCSDQSDTRVRGGHRDTLHFWLRPESQGPAGSQASHQSKGPWHPCPFHRSLVCWTAGQARAADSLPNGAEAGR